MPGDHQKADGKGDDAKLGSNIKPTCGSSGGQKISAAKDRNDYETATRPMSDPISGRRTRLPNDGPVEW
jgi:hypothetical protein